MRSSGGTERALAWAALAGQVAFIAAWIVAGALEPGYSHLEEGVSALGADNALNPAIVNAGLVIIGASFAALGPALLGVLPRRPAAAFAVALFVASGAALALSGLLPLDCGMAVDERCRAQWRAGELSWQHDAHLWSGLVAEVLLASTPFALARALWPGPVAAAAVACGAIGLLISAVFLALHGVDDAPAGLVQRAGWDVLHLWVLIVAVGVLHATRRRPRPGELIPIRPRDFMARAWLGEGELVLRPLFLGRWLTQRFEARRESTWISDRVWRTEDESYFADGRVQRRHMFCEFVADDHVRLTAGDLPDGADVWLEDDGFRISPFRMTFPIGPLPLLVWCHDRSHVERDGTFVNIFDVRSPALRLPLARVTFRVRAQEPDPEGDPTPDRATLAANRP